MRPARSCADRPLLPEGARAPRLEWQHEFALTALSDRETRLANSAHARGKKKAVAAVIRMQQLQRVKSKAQGAVPREPVSEPAAAGAAEQVGDGGQAPPPAPIVVDPRKEDAFFDELARVNTSTAPPTPEAPVGAGRRGGLADMMSSSVDDGEDEVEMIAAVAIVSAPTANPVVVPELLPASPYSFGPK